LRQLGQAEQHVAESKAFIAEQQRVIVESERDGRDWAEAIRTFWKPHSAPPIARRRPR
jgi:hypothetical protein